MNAFHSLKQGVTQAWESVAEGWQHLRERASHALTKFTPDKNSVAINTPDTVRWALLSADMRDDGKHLIVSLEAPGMESGDFDISVSDDHLIVSGEKQMQREDHQGQYHLLERAYGRFERILPLPTEVDADHAKAKYKNGVLTITLRKVQTLAGRRIEVQSL